MQLSSNVQYVPRVGPAMAERLARLEIFTGRDLLYYAPFRYNDYSLVSPIGRIRMGDTVTITATVLTFRNIFTKNGKKIQEAKVQDATGILTVIWFNQVFLARVIRPGDSINLSGATGWFGKQIAMLSPEYELTSADASSRLHTGRLVPVYSETAGVSTKWLRGRIAYLIDTVLSNLIDPLPNEILTAHRLMPLTVALKTIHFPTSLDLAREAKRRLAFDEFLSLALTGYEMRRMWKEQRTAPRLSVSDTQFESFIGNLPYELTADQKKAILEIREDIASATPMNRLLEGDVGSGKTAVAAAAAFIAGTQSRTTLLMAPTQILAAQHFQTLSQILTPHHIEVALVTSESKATDASFSSKKRVYVGTHALLSKGIRNKNIGLVIVDEQHRFGVEQRRLLREKEGNLTPHLLSMTATPIPRTIALTVLGNLSLSALHQMPNGRLPVKTWVVPVAKREKAYEWIKREIHEHRSQVFIVCPLIERSETLISVKAAKAEYEYLKKTVFTHERLSLLHGSMKPKEKLAALSDFRTNQTDVLVTTPVVEVGIDIPNATIMLIEGADRFGLSQLHQLRGRVGRGSKTSYCLLFTESQEDAVTERLSSLERIHNGPELAEVDMHLRGPGDVLGSRQHGLPPLRFATFMDLPLIEEAQKACRALTRLCPDLSAFPHLRETLQKSTIDEVGQD